MNKISPNFYSEAITEFKNLSKDCYSINHLYWWTLKQEGLYKKAKETKHIDSCFGDLPCSCTLDNTENKFIYFYDALLEMTAMHKHESYFEQQLQDFYSIKDDQELIKDWVKKNEQICSEELFLFLIDHLDYEENAYHPVINCSDFKLYVNREDFKNTIKALEFFSLYYWENKILSKSSH
jgi:hypothetical protein